MERETETETETEYGIESVEEDSKRLICKKSNNNNKINKFPDQGRLLWLKESISAETTFIGEYVTINKARRKTIVSKTFDRVKHNLLTEKLTKSPLNPYIVNWYVSFLSDRKQRVVCHNTVCDWKDGNHGTTQVSVSGPYLFNLFLNDLDVAQYCQDSDLTKYADDTSILVTVRKNSVDESQKALNAFLEWTEVNHKQMQRPLYD